MAEIGTEVPASGSFYINDGSKKVDLHLTCTALSPDGDWIFMEGAASPYATS